MQFQNCTTASLLRRKQEFEYAAQLSAIERIAVPEDAAEEYYSVEREITRREELYQTKCTKSHLGLALRDCMLLIGEPDLAQLLGQLAQGQEPGESSDQLRLNPINPFFKEIVLRRDSAEAQADTVRSATFLPGRAIPLAWLRSLLPDLGAPLATKGGPGVHFEVVRVVNGRSGRLEFYCLSAGDSPEAPVSKIVVSCL